MSCPPEASQASAAPQAGPGAAPSWNLVDVARWASPGLSRNRSTPAVPSTHTPARVRTRRARCVHSEHQAQAGGLQPGQQVWRAHRAGGLAARSRAGARRCAPGQALPGACTRSCPARWSPAHDSRAASPAATPSHPGRAARPAALARPGAAGPAGGRRAWAVSGGWGSARLPGSCAALPGLLTAGEAPWEQGRRSIPRRNSAQPPVGSCAAQCCAGGRAAAGMLGHTCAPRPGNRPWASLLA